jgi:hypothetical protein
MKKLLVHCLTVLAAPSTFASVAALIELMGGFDKLTRLMKPLQKYVSFFIELVP